MELKNKKSGSATAIDMIIWITFILTIICFILNYANILKNNIILWIGIVTFTIWYQLWLRIFFGKQTKKLNLNHSQKFFKELSFERKFYNFFKVKKWKKKVLTYDPEAFSLKNHSLEEIANTMCKVETDHWINILISLSTLLFPLLWGQFLIFLIVAILAILFDFQFIMIQRYNRPTIKRLLKRLEERKIKTIND